MSTASKLSSAIEQTAKKTSTENDGWDIRGTLDGLGQYDEESQTPVQPASPPGFPSRRAWRAFFHQEVAHNKYLEAQLLALTLATGIVDAMTYTRYKVFVSKQTGNTLFLALYAIGHPAVQGLEKNVAVSILVFIAGAAFFGHIGHHVKQRRRLWLLVGNWFQTVLVFGATALEYWGDGVSASQSLHIC